DLATDDGDDARAAALFRDLYTRYPRSARAAESRFRAAVIDLVAGNSKGAAAALDSLVTRYPRSEDAEAARYWSGRAWADVGNAKQAQAKWREAVAAQPNSYYASAAARRLNTAPWTPASARDSFPTVQAVDSAMARAELLEQ